eukprot:Nk52_evm79s745 gene=Nk52_evmTU79s745
MFLRNRNQLVILLGFMLALLFFYEYNSSAPWGNNRPPTKGQPIRPVNGNVANENNVENWESKGNTEAVSMSAEDQGKYQIPIQWVYKNFSDIKMFPNQWKLSGLGLSAFEDTRPEYIPDEDKQLKELKLRNDHRINVLMLVHVPKDAKRTGSANPNIPASEREWKWEADYSCRYDGAEGIDNEGRKGAKAYVHKMDVTYALHHSMVMVSCPLPKDFVPKTVSVVDDRPGVKLMLVKDMKVTPVPKEKRKNRIEACIAPMFGDVSENLIEWIEYNRKMGIEHFHFYDFKAHIKTVHILRYYAVMFPNLISVYNWSVVKGFSMHYNGQNLMMQDCFYRNKDHTKNLMFVDVDEYINVKRGNNYHEMLDYLEYVHVKEESVGKGASFDPSSVKPVAMFKFHNWFFRVKCNPRKASKEEIDKNHPVELVTERVIWKRAEICVATDKFVASTSQTLWLRVSLLGSDMDNGMGNFKVVDPIMEGHLNHYRMSDKSHWQPECLFKNGHIKDISIHLHTEGLRKSVETISKNIYWKEHSKDYEKNSPDGFIKDRSNVGKKK